MVSNRTAPSEGTGTDHDKGTLQAILSEISVETLTNQIGLPIDTARAAYIMDSVTVNSHKEFNETIASFYLHLIRHTRKLGEPVDLEAAGAEAFALLERTFSKKGGLQAALAEAKNPHKRRAKAYTRYGDGTIQAGGAGKAYQPGIKVGTGPPGLEREGWPDGSTYETSGTSPRTRNQIPAAGTIWRAL